MILKARLILFFILVHAATEINSTKTGLNRKKKQKKVHSKEKVSQNHGSTQNEMQPRQRDKKKDL